MRPAIDAGDHEFLQSLRRRGTSSIPDLCKMLGVTATAVRQRLGRLEAHGLVVRVAVRAGRGRPHHDYTISESGLQLLGDNYAELALLLWQELHRIEDADVRDKVLARVQEVMVSRYTSEVRSPELNERLGELQRAMAARGFDVELDTSHRLPVLRETNCPYHELAKQDRGICELEHRVLRKVLGVDLDLKRCTRDGDLCCEFEVLLPETRRSEVATESTGEPASREPVS